ncbi:MAG: TIGR03905 family TSCPD domain-containing protein [Deltaproteobacteria bacterium]|nr:TIGR03905 family TSCPD domain-containing protein [Deltaproteobacteria bacterium]
MEYSSQPQGVCPKNMSFEINEGIISDIKFVGGCPGNLMGISLLAEGRPALEVAKTLKGVKCGQRKSSCPNELAKAITRAMKEAKGPAAPKTAKSAKAPKSSQAPEPKLAKEAKSPKGAKTPKAKAKSQIAGQGSGK